MLSRETFVRCCSCGELRPCTPESPCPRCGSRESEGCYQRIAVEGSDPRQAIAVDSPESEGCCQIAVDSPESEGCCQIAVDSHPIDPVEGSLTVAKPQKLYIAGPMTGLPELNYPAFHDAEARLKAAGYETANPAFDGPDHWQWSDYMRRALRQMLECDGVAMLPGYEKSLGARLEMHVAGFVGMKCRPLDRWLALEPAVLDAAEAR